LSLRNLKKLKKYIYHKGIHFNIKKEKKKKKKEDENKTGICG
jgi:hypothetical protein